MTKEEIESEAFNRYPMERNNYELLQRSDVAWDGFVEGAEWAQEEVRSLEALVNAQKAIIDSNERVISELTEALDASNIFCEGVKEALIKSVCGFLEDNLITESLGSYNRVYCFYNDKSIMIDELKKAMRVKDN